MFKLGAEWLLQTLPFRSSQVQLITITKDIEYLEVGGYEDYCVLLYLS